MGDADGVGALREQIDDGRAAQPEVVGRGRFQQACRIRVGPHALQRQVQRDFARRTRRAPQRRQIDVDEIEFLGEREILGQQPVGGMRAGREVDQGFVLGQPHLCQRHVLHAVPAARLRFQIGRSRAQEQTVPQRGHERGLAMQVDAQAVHRQV